MSSVKMGNQGTGLLKEEGNAMIPIVDLSNESESKSHASRQLRTQNNSIMLVGLGGAGGNMLKFIRDSMGKSDNLTYVAINTDNTDLRKLEGHIDHIYRIGTADTEGVGSGGDSRIGALSYQEKANEIEESVLSIVEERQVSIVFVFVGLGGGTGTGTAPAFAEFCRQNTIFSIFISVLPNFRKGAEIIKASRACLVELNRSAHAIALFDNNSFYRHFGNQSAFETDLLFNRQVLNVITSTVRIISDNEMVIEPRDSNDIRFRLNEAFKFEIFEDDTHKDQGVYPAQMLVVASAVASNKTPEDSPDSRSRAARVYAALYEEQVSMINDIQGAGVVIFRIDSCEGENAVTNSEIEEIRSLICESVGVSIGNVDNFDNIGIDKSLEDGEIRLTILASRFKEENNVLDLYDRLAEADFDNASKEPTLSHSAVTDRETSGKGAFDSPFSESTTTKEIDPLVTSESSPSEHGQTFVSSPLVSRRRRAKADATSSQKVEISGERPEAQDLSDSIRRQTPEAGSAQQVDSSERCSSEPSLSMKPMRRQASVDSPFVSRARRATTTSIAPQKLQIPREAPDVQDLNDEFDLHMTESTSAQEVDSPVEAQISREPSPDNTRAVKRYRAPIRRRPEF